MQLYPAIDIKKGTCVRLRQGRFQDVKVYSDSPAQMAERWVAEGATFLHLVDLDGAQQGQLINGKAIREVTRRVPVPVQLGGGIRSLESIEMLLKLGIFRVIIGTKAVEEPEFVRRAVERFGPDHVAVGVDAKDGLVATRGWETVSSRTAVDLCRQMEEMGVRTVIYTDIARDGMLKGPNVEQTRKLAESTGLTVIASGGISSLEDLEELKAAGIPGAILGKSLYENMIDLREALYRFERGEKR